MYMPMCAVPADTKKRVSDTWTGVTVYEPPWWLWKSNLGHLQRQQMILTAEIPLQSLGKVQSHGAIIYEKKP